MRFDEKTITINHHDYLLSGYDYSDYYKVDIIPDYYIFEDGMACNAGAVCYDMGNTIDVHYKVSITPKGKNKSKVVLDEDETIDKEDFDYVNDSVFAMICEWIDNRYGKELFESKKTIKKSLKESKNHKLIEYFDKAIPHYNIAIRDIDNDSELFFGEMQDLKTCSYKNFTVLEYGINSPHYEDIDCLVFYIDSNEDAFEESKKTTKRSLKESNYDLINDDLLAMCKGSTKQLIYAMDDYQSNYTDRSLKELKRRIEEVEDLCDKILYQINKR